MLPFKPRLVWVVQAHLHRMSPLGCAGSASTATHHFCQTSFQANLSCGVLGQSTPLALLLQCQPYTAGAPPCLRQGGYQLTSTNNAPEGPQLIATNQHLPRSWSSMDRTASVIPAILSHAFQAKSEQPDVPSQVEEPLPLTLTSVLKSGLDWVVGTPCPFSATN